MRFGWYDRDFRGITIDRCVDCGIRFMNPQYSDAYLRRYYAGYIDTAETENDPRRGDMRRAQKTEHLELVERFLAPGRLLSLGCGDGLEMRVAAERGWRPEGWDVDPATTRRVAERTGFPVQGGPLEDLRLEAGAYDCIFLDQVLEHPKRPKVLLDACRHALRPGGVLLVACPNIGSISNRWQTCMGRLGLKRRRGRHYDAWHHLHYYTPDELARLLADQGFEVFLRQGDPKPARGRSPLARWNRRLQTAFPMLDSSFRLLARRGPA